MHENQMKPEPKFTYQDIRYSDSDITFQRALKLFATGKVTNIQHDMVGFHAVVLGTQPYEVHVHHKRIDFADCSCYLGQNDHLCKHMLALGLAVLHQHGMVDDHGEPIGNKQLDPVDARLHITAGMRKIRSCNGPSAIWFSYQRDLDVAAGMISEAIPLLEPTLPNTKYLWQLVLRLSKKLSMGGVDDSNGTIGDMVITIVEQIAEFAKYDKAILTWASTHCTTDTGFGFEGHLQAKLRQTAQD